MARIQESVKHEAYEAILHPKATLPVPLNDHESPTSYLHKCRQNSAAELWALYQSKVNPVWPGWRDANMDKFFVSTREEEDADGSYKVAGVFEDRQHIKPKDLGDLKWTLVVRMNRLYLMLPDRDNQDALVLKPGLRVADRYNSGDRGFVHVVGFVHPCYAEVSAILELMHDPRHTKNCMLLAVADPFNRCPFAFRGGGEDAEFSDKVPINTPQRTIVEMLDRNLECIQGPPGTGKSTTIFHIVQTAVPAGYHAIVACVQNKALDSIAEKLGLTGMEFIVYGNPSRLGDSAKRFTLAAQVERDPEVLRVGRALHAASRLSSLLEKAMARIEANWFDDRTSTTRKGWVCLWRAWVQRNHEEYLALRQDAVMLEKKLCDLREQLVAAKTTAEYDLKLVSRASLSTIDGIASAQIIAPRSVVIIDEAGTVPEYKLPLLITRHVEAIVAIGDQNQLQPFSHARADSKTPVDGFFQRMVKALDGRVPMLTEQYRMHPTICELVSDQFYRNRLATGKGVASQRLGVPGGGISWRDYPDEQAESLGQMKKWNRVEVGMIVDFMRKELPALLREGKSVAIITFYKEQFLQLMRAGEDTQTVISREEMRGDKSGDSRFRHHNFRIATVDAAQGSEADVVVLSCVRCNRQHNLGFITDKNRLCVALSRARERLIVIGSKATLCAGDPVWHAVAQAAADRSMI